ncbi:RimK/LysX family protein [Oceanimonas sp. NS1]|nr:RimK/LysX family protein [Oceanimonas sp. NS1]
MTYPVLLGREFLKDIAVVDIARRNVQGKPKRPNPSSE